jgi:Fe-S cluster assembly iron-binding protein IscA
MLENDPTLEDTYFRVLIGGKGCDGFTYQTGFTEKNPDDQLIAVDSEFGAFDYLMDPFTEFYFQSGGEIDYIQNVKTGEEGFVVTNNQENLHQGKFFKDQDHLVPKHLLKK